MGMSAGSGSSVGSADSPGSVGVPRQAMTMLRCRASHLVCMPGTGTLRTVSPERGLARNQAVAASKVVKS